MLITSLPTNFIRVNGRLDGCVFKGGVFHISPVEGAPSFRVRLEIDRKYGGEVDRDWLEILERRLREKDFFTVTEINEMLSCINERKDQDEL